MDQATEYLLLQEAEWGRVLNNLKSIVPNAQKVFIKPNAKTFKTIGKRLGGRELKFIERDAVRRIPGFKKDYLEAQRKVPRLKFATAATSKGIALTTALVSSVTKRTVDDVIKVGEAGVRNSKIIPGPSITQLIIFGLFATFVLSIFLTEGAVIMPAIQTVLYSIGLVILTIGQIIKALFIVAGFLNREPSTTGDGSFIDAMTSPSDIPGDVGFINPEAMMAWVIKALGF